MAYPPSPRDDFFTALAAEILHNYARGRVLVGVDAIAGGRLFADDLAVALRAAGHPVFRASLDDFQRPRAERVQRGATSAEALYLDWYDYSAFLRVLVQPFRMGGSTGFTTANFDAARDMPRESRWVTAPQDAILLVDGPFLQRAELRGIANFVVYLEPGLEALDSPTKFVAPAAVEAGMSRAAAEGLTAQEIGASKLYEAAVGPRPLADAIVDASGDTPKRLFADRC